MKKLWLAALFMLAGFPALAACPTPNSYPFAANCPLPAAELNKAIASRQPTVNARDYGVKCNGVVDDWPAMTAAYAAAAARKANLFITGNTDGSMATCMMGQALQLTTGSGVYADFGTVMWKSTAGNVHPGAELMTGNNQSNIFVRGLIFDGNFPTLTAVTTRLVFINGGDNIVFDKNVFQNTASIGIAFNGSTNPITNSGVMNSTFKNIGMYWATTGGAGLFSNAKSGLNFAGGMTPAEENFNNFALNNDFELIGSDGLDINGQSHIVVANNRFALAGGWKPTTAIGGTTYGVGAIYSVNSPTDFLISGNVIDGATGNAIDLGPNDQDVDGVAVVGNVISNSGGAGIAIAKRLAGFTVTGNAIRNSNLSVNFDVPNVIHLGAISLSCGLICSPVTYISNGVISGNAITDNQVSPTTQYGIWVQTGIALVNVTISSDNNISGYQAAAIGGAIVPPSPRTLATCGVGPVGSLVAFTDQTPVATEVYTAEIFVPASTIVNGVAIRSGSAASGNVKVALSDNSGTVLGASISTTVAGAAGVYQRIPFTASPALYIPGPATYYIQTFYDNNTVRGSTHTDGNCGTAVRTGQNFTTGIVSNAALAPTTFVTAVGPVANLY